MTRRGIVNSAFWAGCLCCLAVVIGPTLWMLIGVVGRAWPVFHFSVLLRDTQGNGGGLRNAIIGTAVLGLGVTLVAGSVSVLAAIYLSEFATGRTRSILRGAYEVLSGVPSIVLGYVGYIELDHECDVADVAEHDGRDTGQHLVGATQNRTCSAGGEFGQINRGQHADAAGHQRDPQTQDRGADDGVAQATAVPLRVPQQHAEVKHRPGAADDSDRRPQRRADTTARRHRQPAQNAELTMPRRVISNPRPTGSAVRTAGAPDARAAMFVGEEIGQHRRDLGERLDCEVGGVGQRRIQLRHYGCRDGGHREG